MFIAHVALHLGLCSAMKSKPPEAPIAVHVKLVNLGRETAFNRTFTVQRGYDPQLVVDFDMTRGTYHLSVEAPRYGCTAADWLALAPDSVRNVNEQFEPGPTKLTRPMIVFGRLPLSFQSTHPVMQLFDRDKNGCDKPITEPLPSHIDSEMDSDAYYAWLYSDASIEAHGNVILALRLQNAGEYRYIRIPMKFPQEWHGWPTTVEFGLDQNELLAIPRMKTDTLLCPKMTKTSVG
ncbi:MAG: hypothetical protein ABR584_02555 [Candidatus Baltobacteraceae bacterium]